MAAITDADRRVLADYVDGALWTVPGFLEPPDARLLIRVHEMQREHDVTGDLLEIGVNFGRSAVLLGFLRDPAHERFVVADAFARDVGSPLHGRAHDTLALAGRRDFERQYRRFHTDLPEVRAGLSAALDPDELGRGRFRLVHVDGGHDWATVDQDAALAHALLSDEGVVVFDDAYNRQFPGLVARVWSEVVGGTLHPIASTQKLYATWNPDSRVAAALRHALAEDPRTPVAAREVAGTRVLVVLDARSEPPNPPLRRRVARAVLPPAAWDVAHRTKRRLRTLRRR